MDVILAVMSIAIMASIWAIGANAILNFLEREVPLPIAQRYVGVEIAVLFLWTALCGLTGAGLVLAVVS